MCSFSYMKLSLALALALLLSLRLSQSQQLIEGVSVQMATTTSAVAFPAADDANAWIIAVTADGRLFFGVKSVTPEQLTEVLRVTPRRRDANLYIKADARAEFASVEKALTAGREDLLQSAVLLASRSDAPHRGTIVPPMGVPVMLTAPETKDFITVAIGASDSSSSFKVNNKETSPATLEDTLKGLLQSQNEKIVSVTAKGHVPFAQVIRVVDAAHSHGATVVLDTPTL